MAEHTIQAQKRTKAEKPAALRAEDKVPAVMYGFETEPVMLTIDRVALNKLYEEAGESTIVQLSIDGETHPVLIQDFQYDPITDFITHADFRRINMDEKVETMVQLTMVGESAAVKELGGTLIQSLEDIEISALPVALVREIEVDVSKLKTFDDVLRVSDIEIPEGIEVLTDVERTIATVQPPRVEEKEVVAEEGEAEIAEESKEQSSEESAE